MSNALDEKIHPTLLSNEEMQTITAVIVKSFDIELARLLVEDKQLRIIEEFTRLYHVSDLFTFFVPINIKRTTENIFEDVLYRSFVMNLTERVSMTLPGYDLDLGPRFFATVSIAISRNKIDKGTHSLINPEVLDSIFLSKEPLEDLLKCNPWLCILYVLLVNFQQSTVFKGLNNSS